MSENQTAGEFAQEVRRYVLRWAECTDNAAHTLLLESLFFADLDKMVEARDEQIRREERERSKNWCWRQQITEPDGDGRCSGEGRPSCTMAECVFGAEPCTGGCGGFILRACLDSELGKEALREAERAAMEKAIEAVDKFDMAGDAWTQKVLTTVRAQIKAAIREAFQSAELPKR